MFRHTKYSSPYGRGKKGMSLSPNDMEGKRLVPDDPDPANGRGKAIMYGGANLDAVSPHKLQQLIKTFQGDYARPNIDKGFGRNQPWGQPHLSERMPAEVRLATGGLIDRRYGADGMSPGQVPWHMEFNSDHGFTAPTRATTDMTTSGMYPKRGDGGLVDYAKGGNWIQHAVNPEHKGYCTPMTKSTCTGARRRFALTMKAHHGFHKKAAGGDFGDMGTDPKDGSVGSKDGMKVVSWKSQGLMTPDTLSRGTMYSMPYRVANSKFGITIPQGANPEDTTFHIEPQSTVRKPVQRSVTYDIGGNQVSAGRAQGDFVSFRKNGGTLEERRKKPGGSNVGRKKFANGKPRTGPYAGPSGGAPSGSYPIPDLGHAKAAIRLSGHAPDPQGIKDAVYRKFPQLKKKALGGRFSGLSAWKNGMEHM